MIKKGKLFLSLVALIFSLGVMCFGVYSAVQVQFNVSGNIEYTAPNAVFNTEIYSSAGTEESTIKARADSFKELGIGNIDLPLAKDENGEPYSYTAYTSDEEGYNNAALENVKLNFSNSQVYYIVVNIKPTKITQGWMVQATIANNTVTENNNLGHYETNTALTFTQANVGQNVVIAMWVTDSSVSIPLVELNITITLTEIQAGVTVGGITLNGSRTPTAISITAPNSAVGLTADISLPTGRSELSLDMTSGIDEYARMFVNYNKNTNSNVKVNASSLYLKDSGIYKIYIDNNSSSAVNLNTLGITVQYDEKESILQYDSINKYFYVEMGTLMRDNATQNEYIKWRLIGKQTEEATDIKASQYTRFSGTTAPPTGTTGVFILETNTFLKRDDGLNEVTFNHSYLGHGSDTSDYHNGDEWEEYNILANDYATSTIRQYINGNNVYKASSSITGGYGPDKSSHYSNMYTDFCIDTENDIVYKDITGRTLKDLYLENGGGSSNSGQPVDFPEQLTTLNKEGYTSSTADKFWLMSMREAQNILGGGAWGQNELLWANKYYWLRSPTSYSSSVGYGVDGSGYIASYGVNDNDSAARAAFSMSIPNESVSMPRFETTYADGGYTITGIGTITDTELTIDTTTYSDGVNGNAPIVAVAEGAFENNANITSVKFSGEKDGQAFNIGANAFKNCTALKRVIIPENIENIGASAFEGCTSLSDLEFQNIITWNYDTYTDIDQIEMTNENSNLSSIGPRAFYGCTSLIRLIFPVKTGITIYQQAFQNSGLTDFYSYYDENVSEDTSFTYVCWRINGELIKSYSSTDLAGYLTNNYSNYQWYAESTDYSGFRPGI